MSKRAILVIDLQKEYLPSGRLPLVDINTAVANAAQVIEAGRGCGDTVIHIRHENPADASVFQRGTPSVEIIPVVQPRAGEQIVVKAYPNAFRDTDLKRLPDGEGAEEVVIVGAMSHICVDATSRAAADLGYAVTVIDDACATMDVEHGGVVVRAEQVHSAYMAALAFAYGRVVSTPEFVSVT